MVWYWLFLLFCVGACVGSLLNVCIYRLPLEKSLLWPASHCGHCYQAIRWADNIPLLSYWRLRGRCRACGASFSMRYFFIELLTALSFPGLFYLLVIENLYGLPALRNQDGVIQASGFPAGAAWALWGHHALLFCFLLVATFCDLDHMEIPLSITIPGTALGLMLAVLLPWPWPSSAEQLRQIPDLPWWQLNPNLGPPLGVYPWPVWGPLPSWLPPGSWQLGLLNGLVGAAAGTVMLRVIRFIFTKGLGVEALGLGDADLMMMAGAFLGWQPVVVAFVLSAFPGLVLALIHLTVRWIRRHSSGSLKVRTKLEAEGTLTLLTEGSVTPVEQIDTAFAEAVQKSPRRAVLVEPEGLQDLYPVWENKLRDAARLAGLRRVEFLDPHQEPGWFASLLGREARSPTPPIPPALALAVRVRDNQPVVDVGGQLLPLAEVQAALVQQAQKDPAGAVTVDLAGLAKFEHRVLATLREAGRRAGIPRFLILDRGLPFGPGLSLGILLTMLTWPWIAERVQIIFFHGPVMAGLSVVCCLLFLVSSYLLRLRRMLYG